MIMASRLRSARHAGTESGSRSPPVTVTVGASDARNPPIPDQQYCRFSRRSLAAGDPDVRDCLWGRLLDSIGAVGNRISPLVDTVSLIPANAFPSLGHVIEHDPMGIYASALRQFAALGHLGAAYLWGE
jgi:hypothetical protein